MIGILTNDSKWIECISVFIDLSISKVKSIWKPTT